MADHAHHWTLDNLDDTQGGAAARLVTLTCDCGAQLKQLTAKSDNEIQTELTQQS